jgi:hypothetical protein
MRGPLRVFVALACLLATPCALALPDAGGGQVRMTCSRSSGTCVALNEPQRLRVAFGPAGVRFDPLVPGSSGWALGFSLRLLGPAGELQDAEVVQPTVARDGIEYVRGRLTERFINEAPGLGHELTLEFSPGSAPASLVFSLSGTLVPKVSGDGREVAYATASGEAVLVYRDMQAVDADGRDVDARWERIEGDEDRAGLRLLIEAADHALPILLTGRFVTPKGAPPVVSDPEATASILPLAAPANDVCAQAAIIPGTGPFPYLTGTYDLTYATSAGDPPLPSCQANVSRSVWFRFTPAVGGSYTLSLCSDAPTGTTVDDTVLAVYEATGSCDGFAETPAGCDDDSCSATDLQSVAAGVDLTAVTTYYIVAWKYGTIAPAPGAGTVQLRVAQDPSGPAPPNDRCEGAEVVPGSGPFPYLTSITTDISGATATGDPPAPACQPNVSRSTWYRFTPAASGRYTFSACADAPTASTVDDTVIAIYTETSHCSGYAQVSGGCDDDSCLGEAAQSVLRGIDLAQGTPYDVVIWHYGDVPPGAGNTTVQLRVSQVLAPENDTCVSAPAISLGAPADATTLSAANDYQLPPGSTCFTGLGQTPTTAPGRDVTWVFTAPVYSRYSFRLSGFETAKNAVLYVASDCPGGPGPAVVASCLGAANRNAGFPAEEVACLPMDAGQTVYVYADEATLTMGSALRLEVSRCVQETEPNDAPGEAGLAACGLEGAIRPAGDADLFVFGSAPPGSRVFAMVDGAAANSTDFDLRLTTAGDTLEYDDLNNDVPFGSVSPNVAGTPLTGASQFVRVSHYSAVAQAEPYRLYLTVQPPVSEAATEIEPNDTPGQATGAPGLYFAGALSSPDDLDLFAVPAAAGDLLFVALDLDPTRNATPFNGNLALLDPGGLLVLQVNDGGATSSTSSGAGSLVATSPYSPAEAIAWRIGTGGTYYVRVGPTAGAPGDYLLSIASDCRSGGTGTPGDVDGDGIGDVDDCAPLDASTWSSPGEATNLRVGAGGQPNVLHWSAPLVPGGTGVSYDLLRATRADDFMGATCLATGQSTTSASDGESPASGFYYLVRVANACGTNLGTRSDGTPRTAPSCP